MRTSRSRLSIGFVLMATTCFGLEPIVWGGKTQLVLDLGEFEARLVLTLDKDFWQIALQRRLPLKQSGIILFRAHPATPENLTPLARAFVEATTNWTAHISIVSADGIQMVAARRN